MIIKKGDQQIMVNIEPAKVFLNVCGGGFNELQTIKAMTLLRHYERENSVKYKGFEFIKDEG